MKLTNPAGRLLIRLQPIATMPAAVQLVATDEWVAVASNTALRCWITPVRLSPSTRTNRPATRGNTPQEMPLRMGHGDSRVASKTVDVVSVATKAQMNRYGIGSVCASFVAANTAGVSTTAVASFDRTAVTNTATTNTSENSRRVEPFARRTARSASH